MVMETICELHRNVLATTIPSISRLKTHRQDRAWMRH